MTITSRYLALPIKNSAPNSSVVLSENGTPVYILDAKISDAPDYTAYIDISRYIGHEIDISPDALCSFADELPALSDSSERLRPLAHFSPEQGWTNDPNGLVYYKGEYHLFFQHNPAGNQWGNMHWGHAVSADLLHWRELPIALYPDMKDGKRVNTIFSGSAIIDDRNVSGLGEGAMLIFYTSAGEPFEQHLAYSNDGRSFTKYDKNPIVPHIAGANRDPKVIWCEEIGCYIMALYLDGNTYALLSSDNLLDWAELQRFELPGDSECPDFYPLDVWSDGLGDYIDGYRRWVFSGASDRYYVGGFEGGIFIPCQQARSLHEGPNVLYAAQTYSDMPDGRRVRFSWDTSNVAAQNNMRWGCQMSVPAEMKLRVDEEGLLALCVYPIEEFASLRCDVKGASAFDMETELEITSENAVIKAFGVEIPIPSVYLSKRIKARIICDRTGVECYFGNGEGYAARGGIPKLTLYPLTAEGAKIFNLKIAGLK